MPPYYLTAQLSYIQLGPDAAHDLDRVLDPKLTHEKKARVFYQVDSQVIAETLLGLFKHDKPTPPADLEAPVGTLENWRNLLEWGSQPVLGVVDIAALDFAERVFCREAIEVLDEIELVGDADPGVWAAGNLPHDKETVLLMGLRYQARQWEPLVRAELDVAHGKAKGIYLWWSWWAVFPEEPTANLNERTYFYRVDTEDLAARFCSAFMRQFGIDIRFGYTASEALDIDETVRANTSIEKYRRGEYTGEDAHLFTDARKWEHLFLTHLASEPLPQEAADDERCAATPGGPNGSGSPGPGGDQNKAGAKTPEALDAPGPSTEKSSDTGPAKGTRIAPPVCDELRGDNATQEGPAVAKGKPQERQAGVTTQPTVPGVQAQPSAEKGRSSGGAQFPAARPNSADGAPTDEERETAIRALLNPLVLIDTGLLNLHVRMKQLREENPHGVFSDTPPTKMTFTQRQEFKNRILAWTNPIQDAIEEAKAKCAGIAMHVTGVIDNPAMWETDLRANLRLLGEGISSFHQCGGASTFALEGQLIVDLGFQLYCQGTRLQDAYQTVEAASSTGEGADQKAADVRNTATASPDATTATLPREALLEDNRPRCAPMSRTEMARRLLNKRKARSRAAAELMKRHGLRQELGTNKYTICVDKLDPLTKDRMLAERWPEPRKR